MTDKTLITIGRFWKNTQILHRVWGDGISLSISLEDFQIALVKEIGSIRWTFRQATFEKQVSEAFKRVIQGVKEESVKSMA